MKRPLYFAVSILILPTLAYWQVSKKPSTAQESSKVGNEIKEAIHQRLDAFRRGDVKAYASFYDRDSIVTGDNGALVKPEHIAKEGTDDHRSGITSKGGEPIDLQVHAYGDMAVASFRTELDQVGRARNSSNLSASQMFLLDAGDAGCLWCTTRFLSQMHGG